MSVSHYTAMTDTITTLIGLQAATGGTTLQDMLNRTAPGLSFMPAFLRKWLQIDISAIIGLLSLIGAMSSGFHFLNHVGLKLYWTLTRFCTASVAVAASDRLNREVLNWLSSTVLLRQGTRVLSARSELVDEERLFYRPKTIRDDCANETRRPVEYMPTFGTTWFWHRKRLFIIRCVRTVHHRGGSFGRENPEEYFDAPNGDEPLVVMCFGRSVAPIKQFLDDCRSWGESQRARYVTVRTCKKTYNGTHWDSTILRPTRPLQTVHFDEQIKKELVADITNYLDLQTRDFYHQRGIPYRRGYLLHGPPGTGKTSLSLALASMFKLELYLLHVPSISNDRELESMFDDLPPRCIILLEDIDAVGIPKRKELATRMTGIEDSDDDEDDDDADNGGERSKSTLSGLLNVLDGVASQEGRILFMTSNLADKLDPALVRPGRIDRKIYLGNINQESSRLMFLRMYAESAGSEDDIGLGPATKAEVEVPSIPVSQQINTHLSASISPLNSPGKKLSTEQLEHAAADFASYIPENMVTPALIQGFLLSHRSAPLAARDGIQRFVKDEVAKMEQARTIAQRAREVRARKRKSRAIAQLETLASLAAKANDDGSTESPVLAPEPPGTINNPPNYAGDDIVAGVKESVADDQESTEQVPKDNGADQPSGSNVANGIVGCINTVTSEEFAGEVAWPEAGI